jgi:hypothetical protein
MSDAAECANSVLLTLLGRDLVVIWGDDIILSARDGQSFYTMAHKSFDYLLFRGILVAFMLLYDVCL